MTKLDDTPELQIIVNECRTRGITLEDIRKSFSSISVEPPKQWRSIPNIIKLLSEEKLTKLTEKINKILKNHRFYNDKLVVIYEEQNPKSLKKLDELFTSISTGKKLSNNYLADDSYDLSEKDKITLHNFKKLRSLFAKEDIDVDKLPKDTQSEFNQFDRLIGVRATKLNCYDAIIFDFENNMMILQLDLISMMNSGEVDKNIEDFLNTLNSIIVNHLDDSFKISTKKTAINLYGCIKKFYNNIEGAITRLSFTTSKGVHHETLKGAAKDIRKADYHIGGKAKESGNIYPYRVTKKFELDSDNKPQAFIGVRYDYFVSPGNKFLASARIIDVMNYKSYIYILRKIIENR